MKVKDLINILKQYDEEDEVILWGWADDGTWDTTGKIGLSIERKGEELAVIMESEL